MILLFDVNETAFDSNGIGALSESDSCIITENRNGAYELKMTYPVSGVRFNDLKTNRIIFCKPNPYANPQPFRIYRISKPLKETVAVYANHISYDLSGVPVSPFTASSAIAAMQAMEDKAAVDSPFNFYTDKVTNATMTVDVPSSSRALLGGQQGSLLDVYGGEYEFDRFTVNLLNKRGANNGVSIRYGKNLTSIEQDVNISSVYTGIYPFWKKEDVYVELPEKVVNAEGTFPKQKIQPVDMSNDFEEEPSIDELREAAEQYIKNNKVGVPAVNIKVSFVALEQTEQYKDIAILEKVMLCDDVNVEFPALEISATAECVTTEYDAVTDRYTQITLGEATTSIADTIAGNTQEIKDKPSYSFLDQAVNNATNWITSGAGYMVAVKDTAGNWKEICSLDTPDIETAINVWRWNNGGFGHSSKGYNGPYDTAITQDGQIVADFITAGEMNAGVIKAGLLKGHKGNAYFNLDTGELAADKLIDPDQTSRYLAISNIKGLTGRGLTYVDPVNASPTFQVRGQNINSVHGANLYFPSEMAFYLDNVDRVNPITALSFSRNDLLIKTMNNFNMQTNYLTANRIISGYNDDTYISMATSGITVHGFLSVTGNKNRIVKTSKGMVALSAYETACPYFGDIGSSKMDDSGECIITIDPLFLETVNTESGYVVFLQKNGPGELWVESKEAGSFTVKGTKNLAFDYEIKAKQKGYENTRLEVIRRDGAAG